MEEVFEKMPPSFAKHDFDARKVCPRGDHQATQRENRQRQAFGNFRATNLWRRVDLKNKYCTHVVIAKIPFDPPTTPVEKVTAKTGLKSLEQLFDASSAGKLLLN